MSVLLYSVNGEYDMTHTFELQVRVLTGGGLTDRGTATFTSKTFQGLVKLLDGHMKRLSVAYVVAMFEVTRYCVDHSNDGSVTRDVCALDVNADNLPGVNMLFHSLVKG